MQRITIAFTKNDGRTASWKAAKRFGESQGLGEPKRLPKGRYGYTFKVESGGNSAGRALALATTASRYGGAIVESPVEVSKQAKTKVKRAHGDGQGHGPTPEKPPKGKGSTRPEPLEHHGAELGGEDVAKARVETKATDKTRVFPEGEYVEAKRPFRGLVLHMNDDRTVNKRERVRFKPGRYFVMGQNVEEGIITLAVSPKKQGRFFNVRESDLAAATESMVERKVRRRKTESKKPARKKRRVVESKKSTRKRKRRMTEAEKTKDKMAYRVSHGAAIVGKMSEAALSGRGKSGKRTKAPRVEESGDESHAPRRSGYMSSKDMLQESIGDSLGAELAQMGMSHGGAMHLPKLNEGAAMPGDSIESMLDEATNDQATSDAAGQSLPGSLGQAQSRLRSAGFDTAADALTQQGFDLIVGAAEQGKTTPQLQNIAGMGLDALDAMLGREFTGRDDG